MSTAKQSLGTLAKLNPFRGLAPRKAQSPAGERPEARDAPAQALERYPNTLYKALASFRFFSFAMGAVFSYSLAVAQGNQPPVSVGAVILIVGLYNVVRVLVRPGLQRATSLLDRLFLGIDVILAMEVVFLTGGLASPFLIYSLAPILVASLLMDNATALSAALISALLVAGMHLVGPLNLGVLSWLFSGNYLALVLLYGATCLLAALLPFLANLNWQRRQSSLAQGLERERLRREVHDDIAQTLAFLSLKIARAQEREAEQGQSLREQDLRGIAQAVERCYLAVRDYLDGSEGLDAAVRLSTALATAARAWSQETGLRARLETTGEEWQVPPNARFHMVQIAREALVNVAKHAMAARVRVEVRYTPTDATLRVKDDGRGFHTSQPRGHGMTIMQERATLAGASFTISSTPGQGTEVVVVYPRHGNQEGRSQP